MTTISTTTIATPTLLQTVHRTLASEIIKLRTVRSSVWLLVAATAFTLLSGPVQALGEVVTGPSSDVTRAADSGPMALSIALTGTTTAVLIIGVLGVLLVTGEYVPRSIRTTFMLVPGRTHVVVAKMLAGGTRHRCVRRTGCRDRGDRLTGAAVAGRHGRHLEQPQGAAHLGRHRLVSRRVDRPRPGRRLADPEQARWLRAPAGSDARPHPSPGLIPGRAGETVVGLMPASAGAAMVGPDGTNGLGDPVVGFALWTAYMVLCITLSAWVAGRRDA